VRAGSLALVLVAAAVTCARAHGDATVPSRTSGVEVAKVVAVAAVRGEAGSGPVVRLLATRTSWAGGPQQLLVLGSRVGADGRQWLRVRLPGRPNGSAGWIPRDAVLVHRVRWWIDVSLSQRVVRVFRDGTLVRRFRAVVGALRTPTPTGLFAVYELDAQPDRNGFLGPWVLQLTAFSDVLDNYGGGPGRVAIHGRGGASLDDPLGTARSHGCVRVDNSDVAWLAKTVVPGTPVRISP
jgi:lipoprotein-anchoring transpeptidase ErfK/SrfK